MTKYLGSGPFQVGGYSKAFTEKWDAVFGKETVACPETETPIEDCPHCQELEVEPTTIPGRG